jgi:hypothetical protein
MIRFLDISFCGLIRLRNLLAQSKNPTSAQAMSSNYLLAGGYCAAQTNSGRRTLERIELESLPSQSLDCQLDQQETS